MFTVVVWFYKENIMTLTNVEKAYQDGNFFVINKKVKGEIEIVAFNCSEIRKYSVKVAER